MLRVRNRRLSYFPVYSQRPPTLKLAMFYSDVPSVGFLLHKENEKLAGVLIIAGIDCIRFLGNIFLYATLLWKLFLAVLDAQSCIDYHRDNLAHFSAASSTTSKVFAT